MKQSILYSCEIQNDLAYLGCKGIKKSLGKILKFAHTVIGYEI